MAGSELDLSSSEYFQVRFFVKTQMNTRILQIAGNFLTDLWAISFKRNMFRKVSKIVSIQWDILLKSGFSG
jgi:hypothetical protein